MLIKKQVGLAAIMLSFFFTPAWSLSIPVDTCQNTNSILALLKEGKASLAQKQYAKAQTCFEKAAQTGNSDAQNHLAALLLQQNPNDSQKPLDLFLQAAKQGNPKAQFNLGLLYWDLVDENDANNPKRESARYWLNEAAKQNLPEAQYQLGMWYFHHQDYPKAKEYFQLAAKQNHADALMQMGKMHYQKGDAHLYGHVPNDALAQKYFEQAAKQDQPEAHFYLGAIHYLEISRHSYPAKANQHVKKAKKHFTAACQLGDTEACLWQKELTKMHDKAQDSHISINTTPSFT